MLQERTRPMKITRRSDNEFDLIGAEGNSPVKVGSIGIVTAKRVIWWIVSDEYSETWIPTGAVTFFSEESGAINRQMKSLASKSGERSLARITYGEVPKGFRQMTPEKGPPPKLKRGVQYVLHVVGRDFDTFEFEF